MGFLPVADKVAISVERRSSLRTGAPPDRRPSRLRALRGFKNRCRRGWQFDCREIRNDREFREAQLYDLLPFPRCGHKRTGVSFLRDGSWSLSFISAILTVLGAKRSRNEYT